MLTPKERRALLLAKVAARIALPKVQERFWAKVERRGPDDCWPWSGSKHTSGYGSFCPHRDLVCPAHRVSVLLDGRAIPPDMVVDHLCRNRLCVNPAHLDVVTQSTNVKRGNWPQMRREWSRQRTHCSKGHRMDDENTHVSKRGRRDCRACARNWQRAKRQQMRQRQNEEAS